MKSKSKSSAIFIRVTDDFNKSIDKIVTKSPVIVELESRGYDIDKSVLGRFAYLLVSKYPTLLLKNLDLLLAASKSGASEELLQDIIKELKI